MWAAAGPLQAATQCRSAIWRPGWPRCRQDAQTPAPRSAQPPPALPAHSVAGGRRSDPLALQARQRPQLTVRASSGGGEHQAAGGEPAAAADEAGSSSPRRPGITHLVISSMWDEEMLEETAERERAHLCRTHQLPGCYGSSEDQQPREEEQEGQLPHEQGAAAQGADASAGGRAAGSSSSGGGSGSAVATGSGRCLLLEPEPSSEGTEGPEGHRRWRVRLSPCAAGGSAPPAVGGPTWAGAASVGEQPPAGAPKQRLQRKPLNQLKAGNVSLPSPQVHRSAEEPPSAGELAARWEEAPPLAPPLAPAEQPGVLYADTGSQQLLRHHETPHLHPPAPLEPPVEAPVQRQEGQDGAASDVLRLFSVADPRPRPGEPRSRLSDDDATFRGSFVGAVVVVAVAVAVCAVQNSRALLALCSRPPAPALPTPVALTTGCALAPSTSSCSCGGLVAGRAYLRCRRAGVGCGAADRAAAVAAPPR